jgi:Tfp pilus assembly protein PilO
MAQLQSRPLMDKLQTALLSIATTGIIALCGFAVEVASSLARIEQQQTEDERFKDTQQAKMNTMALDVVDLKMAVTELKQQIKSN